MISLIVGWPNIFLFQISIAHTSFFAYIELFFKAVYVRICTEKNCDLHWEIIVSDNVYVSFRIDDFLNNNMFEYSYLFQTFIALGSFFIRNVLFSKHVPVQRVCIGKDETSLRIVDLVDNNVTDLDVLFKSPLGLLHFRSV